MWEVEFTDEFEVWWNTLDEDEQEAIAASIELMERIGPALPRPHADTIQGSRHSNMKELRTQHKGRPLRTFFAFDPRRCAILLIGGDKTGDKRFYERMIAIADRLYDEHLAQLRKEGFNLMSRKFDELRAKMTPARRERARSRANEMLVEMLLAELRQLAGLTQTELASELGIKQPTLSRLESREDMQISTLRRIVEALGGELEIVAKLPRGRISLSQFRSASELQHS